MLQAAEPDDPQDAVVARQYKEEPEVYRMTAKHWAQEYAGGKSFNAVIIFCVCIIHNNFCIESEHENCFGDVIIKALHGFKIDCTCISGRNTSSNSRMMVVNDDCPINCKRENPCNYTNVFSMWTYM